MRAFSTYFHLANVTEQVHRAHGMRDRRAAEGGLLARTADRLKDADPEHLRATVKNLNVRPVFTAHPTEAARRSVLNKLRRIAELLEAPEASVLDGGTQVLGVGVLEPVGGAGQEPALGGAAVAHLVGAVDLLGDVGEVEVGGEGAHELCGGLQVGVAEERGRRFAVGAGQGAYPLDEVEEFLAFLAYEGLAEEVTEAADVGAQLGAGGGGLVGTAHSVRLLAVNEEVRRSGVSRWRCCWVVGGRLAGYGALRQAAVLLPRPDERVRTALSDPSRIGVVASGVSAALAGGGERRRHRVPTPRAAGLPRTTGWTGFSCCGPRHCHTYQAVGYGTVATAVRALLPHPPGDSPMPSTPDVIDEPGPSATATTTISALPPATLGGDKKRSIEQFALLAFIVVPFVALVAAVPLAWGWGVSWLDVGLLVAMYFIGCHGITIGFHRYFTHGSFKAKRPLRIALAVMGSLAVEGPLVRWVADHRKHHKFSDAEGDPHSPWRFGESLPALMKGLWWAHIAWMFDEEQTPQQKYAPDLIKDPAIRAISRHFLTFTIVSLAIPPLVGGLVTMSWWGAATAFFWGSLVRVALLHHVTWSINSICHAVGKRPFKSRDRSGNVWWLAVLSCGESWHNLHHADPTSARHGVMRGQIDSSARLIRWFEQLGWASDVRWPDAARIDARRTPVPADPA
ncbi:Phosphoenolpyruvate carboxylase [Streptomyces cyaneofuscatus]